MGDPLQQAQSSLIPSLVTIIHHPELQKKKIHLALRGEPTPTSEGNFSMIMPQF